MRQDNPYSTSSPGLVVRPLLAGDVRAASVFRVINGTPEVSKNVTRPTKWVTKSVTLS
jgi:hypothetical protein